MGAIDSHGFAEGLGAVDGVERNERLRVRGRNGCEDTVLVEPLAVLALAIFRRFKS